MVSVPVVKHVPSKVVLGLFQGLRAKMEHSSRSHKFSIVFTSGELECLPSIKEHMKKLDSLESLS